MDAKTAPKPSSFMQSLLRNPAETDPGEAVTSGAARPHTGQDIMLELRFKTGDCEALSYAYLVRARFDAAGSIRLGFSVCNVVIEGRNLKPVFDRIIQHKVAFIAERNAVDSQLADVKAEVVTRIRICNEGEEEEDG